MRTFLTTSLLVITASICAASDLKIIRVWPGYRTAESFERISEFLGKDEDPSNQLILRTQENTRAGYYFLVRAKNFEHSATANAKIELRVITPFSPEAKTYNFTCTLPTGSHVLNLGLTGTDWPGKPTDDVVAWQLRVLASDGTELAKTQSHLWAQPEK